MSTHDGFYSSCSRTTEPLIFLRCCKNLKTPSKKTETAVPLRIIRNCGHIRKRKIWGGKNIAYLWCLDILLCFEYHQWPPWNQSSESVGTNFWCFPGEREAGGGDSWWERLSMPPEDKVLSRRPPWHSDSTPIRPLRVTLAQLCFSSS